MTRRTYIALIAGNARAQGAERSRSLDPLFGAAQGVAIAMDFKTKRMSAAHRLELARGLVARPGSVVKPLSLLALIDAGKLGPGDTLPCTGQLRINGASFACAHPKLQSPVDAATAIAYSCNEFVAQMAGRFAAGELADAFSRYGLTAERAPRGATTQLQALGERNVTATALQMASAYQRLAGELNQARYAPILAGLEGAVEYGTAQHAAVAGVQVAGKTGTAPGSWAWFAGFAPSRAPRAIVVVLVRGHSGGADAAPIAGRILAAQLDGRLEAKP